MLFSPAHNLVIANRKSLNSVLTSTTLLAVFGNKFRNLPPFSFPPATFISRIVEGRKD